MKILPARNQHKVGDKAVSRQSTYFSPLNLETSKNENSPPDLEIERSLYYLGRALYRYSLLMTKKGEK